MEAVGRQFQLSATVKTEVARFVFLVISSVACLLGYSGKLLVLNGDEGEVGFALSHSFVLVFYHRVGGTILSGKVFASGQRIAANAVDGRDSRPVHDARTWDFVYQIFVEVELAAEAVVLRKEVADVRVAVVVQVKGGRYAGDHAEEDERKVRPQRTVAVQAAVCKHYQREDREGDDAHQIVQPRIGKRHQVDDGKGNKRKEPLAAMPVGYEEESRKRSQEHEDVGWRLQKGQGVLHGIAVSGSDKRLHEVFIYEDAQCALTDKIGKEGQQQQRCAQHETSEGQPERLPPAEEGVADRQGEDANHGCSRKLDEQGGCQSQSSQESRNVCRALEVEHPACGVEREHDKAEGQVFGMYVIPHHLVEEKNEHTGRDEEGFPGIAQVEAGQFVGEEAGKGIGEARQPEDA